MTRLRHYDDTGMARFITFSCYRRLPFLSSRRSKQILIDFIDHTRSKHGFKLCAYVIMPEHVHLVLNPPEKMKLGLVVREIKSRSARQYFAEFPAGKQGDKRVFWERRCYDHNCRSHDTVIEKIRYCHNNPVTRGTVSDPAEWEWSSYNAYSGVVNVPLLIDPVEP